MYLPQAFDATAAATLESRQIGGGGYRYRTRRRTPWYSWGRWVLAGILIFLGIMILFAYLCIARRRRSRLRRAHGAQAPMSNYGQGAPPVGTDNYGYNNQYNNQAAYGNAPPPTYGGGAANEYYGQQSGVSKPQGAHFR